MPRPFPPRKPVPADNPMEEAAENGKAMPGSHMMPNGKMMKGKMPMMKPGKNLANFMKR